MIGAFRRSGQFCVVTLVALLGALAMPAMPLLHGGDDKDCVPVVEVHQAAGHQVGDATDPPAPPEHCIVCHWSQWGRAIRGEVLSVVGLTDAGPATTHSIGRQFMASASRFAARAPPLA